MIGIIRFWCQTIFLCGLFCLLPHAATIGAEDPICESNDRGPSVVVIGAGPGGLFFCHALEIKRLELEAKGDMQGLARLPVVTVYESAATHGGLWSSDRTKSSTHRNMYEALWINGAKERNEMWDYTFQDHFGVNTSVPAFLPRGAMLDYMTARVTRNSPKFFERYVKFQTNVTLVTYSKDKKAFQVHTTDLRTTENRIQEFEKCVWAAGEYGPIIVPQDILSMLREGGFQGRIIHSSETTELKQDVESKRILIVGGSWSAEDLALMAIKLGVEKVFISHRSPNAPVTWPENWPFDKVELLSYQVPNAMVKEPNSEECIQFRSVVSELEVEPATICNIQTIIFATGYDWNINMLDDSVALDGVEEWNAWLNDYVVSDFYPMPKHWKMDENEHSKVVGDVDPAKELFSFYKTFPYLYLHSIDINNPSMMYMFSQGIGFNGWFSLDMISWILVGYLSGDLQLPDSEGMRQQNQERILEFMNHPYTRQKLDENYELALTEAGLEFDEEYDEVERMGVMFEYFEYADLMERGHHPMSLGSFGNLNEKGQSLVHIFMNERDYARNDDPKKGWKTFRDKECIDFASIYTGVKPLSFNQPWIEIDDLEDPTKLV